MKRKLKEELVRMSTDIITSRNMNEISELYDAAKALYEKLAVLKYIEEKLNDLEVDVSKNAIASKFEKMATAVINENKLVPETNPHEEDIITPGMETIRDMVKEMHSGSIPVDEIFAEFKAKPEFTKKESVVSDNNGAKTSDSYSKWSVEKPGKEIKIDLNDRIAFVKHLFNGSTEDLNRVISQLNTIDSQERSVAFVENMIKPDYNQWAGKEEYESRFMALIERRFS
ncbi:hypothetical protein U1E44_00230 [Arenibacter sp. GZD96]|uniref:hypothetical protein n=1 Tax=Aurantibrevibacter litoralis TaxID=3106030 RepID=UPI002AFE85CB|nr:hypothetical protein [Arenibacter sp. GZD-96]MEA1784506.1 hypothetical protein [Arenibacter sp. GZD-96]